MKALWRNDVDHWSLYNVAVDPAETNDMAESAPAVRDSLVLQWDAWAETVGVFDKPEK